MFISMLVNVFDESSAVDSGGAHPEFEGSEREINNLLLHTSTPRFEKLSTALMSYHSISVRFWVGVKVGYLVVLVCSCIWKWLFNIIYYFENKFLSIPHAGSLKLNQLFKHI